MDEHEQQRCNLDGQAEIYLKRQMKDIKLWTDTDRDPVARLEPVTDLTDIRCNDSGLMRDTDI